VPVEDISRTVGTSRDGQWLCKCHPDLGRVRTQDLSQFERPSVGPPQWPIWIVDVRDPVLDLDAQV
jgi:hypothetical protein